MKGKPGDADDRRADIAVVDGRCGGLGADFQVVELGDKMQPHSETGMGLRIDGVRHAGRLALPGDSC